jgi:hypothetical protein
MVSDGYVRLLKKAPLLKVNAKRLMESVAAR